MNGFDTQGNIKGKRTQYEMVGDIRRYCQGSGTVKSKEGYLLSYTIEKQRAMRSR